MDRKQGGCPAQSPPTYMGSQCEFHGDTWRPGGGKRQPGKGVCSGADMGIETAKVRSSKIHGGVNTPGGPAAKTLPSQCRGLGFDPWSEN